MYARVLEVLYVVTVPLEGKNERCFLAWGFRRWWVENRQACFAIDFPCDDFSGGNLSPKRNRCNQRQTPAIPSSFPNYCLTKTISNLSLIPNADVDRFEGSEVETETVGNALEAECYSEASTAAFISLFLISITSLIYRAGDGDRTRDVQLGNMDAV